MTKQYDRTYFDHWYRSEAASGRRAWLARKVAMVVATAEYHLGRPLQSVLDVGCGEGAWRAPLLKLRPSLHYLGLDSSAYAVARHGRARNLHRVDFADLAELRFERSFDLLVCSDVMHYVPTRVLDRGLLGFAELCHGVAFLEVFCRGDAVEGDTVGYIARTPGFYRERFTGAGFTACGSHLYLADALAADAMALEVS